MTRQKKLLLTLPLLVLPFTTLLFWALGGGSAAASEKAATKQGMNAELPLANNKEEPLDKMSFYDLARRDSQDRAQALSLDPYNKAVQAGMAENPYGHTPLPQETKLQEQLTRLKSIVNEPLPTQPTGKPARTQAFTPEIEATQPAKDPELEQLSGMIDKILDIQHPERVSDKKSTATESQTLKSFTAVKAVIPETQTLVSGAVIRIRLTNDLVISDSAALPAGSVIYGTTALREERLLVHIPSVRSKNRIIPVQLTVYDSDGIEGIYIPGAINRQVAKESGEDAISNMDLGTLDPSLKAQAASAGIKAARSLLSRKIKLTRLTVPAGHEVYVQFKQ